MVRYIGLQNQTKLANLLQDQEIDSKMPNENELRELIEDQYGTPETLASWLDLAVEMLFYVEEDTFSRIELQEVATALRKLTVVLRGYEK